MVNVGMMNKRQVNKLVSDLRQYDKARVRESDIHIGVTIDSREVLSAALLRPGKWHVRAVEGLVLVEVHHGMA